MNSEIKIPTPSSLCKRRFSTILSLKTKLIHQNQQQSGDEDKSLRNFAKHFVTINNNNNNGFPSKEEILKTCSCVVCEETIVQRQQIIDYLKKVDDEDEKKQK